MKTLKPSLVSMLLIALFISCFNLNAQEESSNYLFERFIGTLDLETFKTYPDSLMGVPEYTVPIVANFELTKDGNGLIHTNHVTFNGAEFFVTMAHFYYAQNNEMYSLGADFRGVTTFPDDNSMLVKQYDFDDVLLNTQKLSILSKDEFEIEMEIFEGDSSIKLWTRAKRRP